MIKSTIQKAFAISVVGAAAWAVGSAVQYGGESLLSHLEAEKVTNMALWALAKGCEGGGDFLARGGWFVATLIPSYTYKAAVEFQPHITPPFVERVFNNTISPAYGTVSNFTNTSIVQPMMEHGPEMVASFGKNWCLPAAGAVGGAVAGAAKWTFGTALPAAFNFTAFSVVVPTVTTVGSYTFHGTVGALGLGFGALSWVGDTGSSCLASISNFTANNVANATVNATNLD